MKPLNHSERKEEITSFSILLFLVSCVIFLLLSSLSHSDTKAEALAKKMSNPAELQENKMHQYNETLHSLLNRIQQLDKQYAFVLTHLDNNRCLDSLNIVIHQEEEYLSATVARISEDGVQITDPIKRKQLESMIALFKSIVEDRNAINTLRNAVGFKAYTFSSNEGETDLNNELTEENGNISAQENLVSVSNP